MWRTVGITFESDGGHANHWRLGKTSFQFVVFRLAGSQTDPPAVIVNHDADVVRQTGKRDADRRVEPTVRNLAGRGLLRKCLERPQCGPGG